MINFIFYNIIFRNVYLKNFSIKNYNEFICFDLGCNRGVFSVIASKIFKFVTCIDLQQKYENCIHEIMLNNNQKNYEFISGIVGSLKVSERLGSNQKTINLNDIIRKRSNGEKIFLKIDIEGGEFKLFEEIDLSLINTIVIEIHSNKGNLNQILDKLKNNNFKFFCFDDQLTNLTYPNKKISFVTAEK